MIEYIFFDVALRDRFVNHLQQCGVPCTAIDDTLGLVVEIPEDITEEMADGIEAYYDTLDDEQARLSKADGDLKHLAGFHFKLPNGEARMLPLSPEMAGRLLQSFSLEELQVLFEDVARCVLNPNEEHLCKILAAQDKKD